MGIKAKLTTFDTTMIVVSLVIGIGIFRVPAMVAAATRTPLLFFLAWGAGGLISLFGGLTFAEVGSRFGRLDGILHSIGYAPDACLGRGMFEADWEDVATAVEISAYSLKVLASAFVGLLEAAGGASIVGLDFDATVAWPGYDWMGVAKAALESLTRYLARDLGSKAIRVNLVAAGPVRTVAARSIPGFERFEKVWEDRAPLGWDVNRDREAVARACVALLSDWFPRTTGEIVHVDGGYHAIGA